MADKVDIGIDYGAVTVERTPSAFRSTGTLLPGKGGDGSVTSGLVFRAARRLEIVCIVAIVSVLVLWFGTNALRGELAAELRTPHEWLPPVVALVASAAMLAAARRLRAVPSTLLRLGLLYEVVISFAIAGASHLWAFDGMVVSDFNVDRIGLSYVAPWMLLFTILVPAPPAEALVALVTSACAVPLLYLGQVAAGMAPALDAGQFVLVFVAPYAVSVGTSYVAARIVHQLGVEVRHAHELGSYRLEALLGRGGMGEVWRASHRMLARKAAVKVIRREALAHDATAAAVAIARFEREAQVIASLTSPHTVQLYDFGTTEDGALFYVMELLNGVDLDAFVRRYGPLGAERVVHVLQQACASLAEAHRRGLVHRDIKPANIYLCRLGLAYDVVKVLDFGLVKQSPREGPAADTALTRADVLAGTPAFMAPEMALNPLNVDGRADLYALGCVAFWLLTGRVVFEADTPTATLLAHVQGEPPAPSSAAEQDVPELLDRIVLDCLGKDPAARPATAEALSARLAAVPCQQPWTGDDAARWWEAHAPSVIQNVGA